ncbi:MAG: hypothetical protein FWH48_08710 [Oscillospiraceae bacterium]|nr:hypothetical protein [Oscillospiraceae bacterium]
MFGFLNKIKNKIKKNDENNPEYRLGFARRIAWKKIKYVSERTLDPETGEIVDSVIGKNGFFSMDKNDELSVYCGGEELFRAYVPELLGYEFLSLEGAVLEGFDLVSERLRIIIVYYIYHRK